MPFVDRLRVIGRKMFGKGGQKKRQKEDAEKAKSKCLRGLRLRRKKRGGWGGRAIIKTSCIASHRYSRIMRKFRVTMPKAEESA